jgi:dethiobiotin synthetase
MKPVAAGASLRQGAWHNEDVDALMAAGNVQAPMEMHCPYLLEPPIAPHIAARLAGVEMQLETVLQAYRALAARAQVVVVEGVGGFRVPLGTDWDSADLAVALNLPVVMVVGLRLGCLNHACLTAESIAARGLRLAGWVGNCIDPDMDVLQENLRALEGLLPAPCLGVIPHLARPVPELAVEHLDPAAFDGDFGTLETSASPASVSEPKP